ncbi:Acrylyl-CoA reductase AcuI [compost metagenome]
MRPRQDRIDAWNRLDRDLDRTLLERITQTVALKDIIPMAQKLLAGQVRGRLVVALDV